MNLDTPFQGTLFANDFLSEAIVDTPDWQAIDDDAVATLEASLREVFDHFPIDGSPNESQTEDDLIWLVLVQLGWTASLRQQNLSARGRGRCARRSAVSGRIGEGSSQWIRRGMEAL